MIAVIYCRKSNSQDVADEVKSVTRQEQHARDYAHKKGWSVDDRFVFVDDGISSVEFANRPGFVRLMNAVDERPSARGGSVSIIGRLCRRVRVRPIRELPDRRRLGTHYRIGSDSHGQLTLTSGHPTR